jgi:hypothetical protein
MRHLTDLMVAEGPLQNARPTGDQGRAGVKVRGGQYGTPCRRGWYYGNVDRSSRHGTGEWRREEQMRCSVADMSCRAGVLWLAILVGSMPPRARLRTIRARRGPNIEAASPERFSCQVQNWLHVRRRPDRSSMATPWGRPLS